MKKFKFRAFLGLTLVMALSLASCGKDKNDEPTPGEIGEVPTLPTPEYASTAACYKVTSPGSDITSIEITESGDYIVTKSGYGYHSPVYQGLSKKLPPLPPILQTRAGAGSIIYGKAIKITDTEYILEGFGTIVIEGDTNNSISIIVSTENGETIDLSTQKVQSTAESPLTAAMCRSWNLDKIGIRFEINNEVIYNEKKPASKFNDLMNGCMHALVNYMNKFAPAGEKYEAEEMEFPIYPKGLLLSRAGSYMVEYSDESVALAKWKWQNEEKQIFHYSWDYANPDAYIEAVSGDATVAFSGKEMILQEDHLMSEDGMTVSSSTYYYCN